MILMHMSYSVSRYIVYFILLLSAVCSYAGQSVSLSGFKGYSILAKDANSSVDNKWAGYLLNQARNRVVDQSIIIGRKANRKDFLNVYLHIDGSAEYDYSISAANNEVMLAAASEKVMLWLVYQYIAKIAESDSRWNASDLAPAIIDWTDTDRKFDFGYRSIYSSAMADTDRLALSGDMHVDYDWGLWGHNLKKVFGGNTIPADARATVNGRKSDSQFCFSSEVLMKAISEYIIDLYGNGNDGNTGWFCIVPNDNPEVCTCEKCKKAGNTNKSATPAVTSLIIRLAEKFPNHHFYTSAYNTTTEIPLQKFPKNAGVLISAIDLPLNTYGLNSPEYIAWKTRLVRWKSVTNKIIIWDYMRNFDDYLTPYPCLLSIQQRMKWFKSLGVYGVFYNGSGDDYSTFDDLQTYIISSLLKNCNMDVLGYAEKYLHKFYPKSHTVIYDYYVGLENEVKDKNITLEWYSGIDRALQSYLNADKFRAFYSELDKISKMAKGEERKKLNMLLTALNFTQLEIIRSGYCKDEIKNKDKINEYLELLKGFMNFKAMANYKEAHGALTEYTNSWERNIYFKPNESCHISASNNSKLTDGYYGSPFDYHTHWVILKKDLNEIKVDVAKLDSGITVEISFLNAPKWKIAPPSKIEIYQGDVLKGAWNRGNEIFDDFSVVKAEIDIKSVLQEKALRILVYRGDKPQMACDEISVYDIKE